MKRLFFMFAVSLLAFTSQAQVTNFSLFKVTVYHQDTPAAPTQPDHLDAYYFAAQMNFVDGEGVTNVSITGPNLPTSDFVEVTTNYYTFNVPYYDQKTNFDAAFPAGEYDFEVDYTNYSDYGAVIIPAQDIYTTNIAAYTPACWQTMQQVNPSQDFTLNWNPFVPNTNTTSSYTFINVFDVKTGNNAYSAGYLPPDTTTTNIPANTLLYGETYEVDTYFSDRQDTQDAGFGGALGTVGFDNLTYTSLVTISPWLQIAPAGDDVNVVLTWPAIATNYVLESESQLTAGNQWAQVPNPPSLVGTSNVLVLPTIGSSRFFRLHQLTPIGTAIRSAGNTP